MRTVAFFNFSAFQLLNFFRTFATKNVKNNRGLWHRRENIP